MQTDIYQYNNKGQAHGYWEVYYPNGQLFYKGEYVDNERHGPWVTYFDNGQLSYKGEYVNDKRYGFHESYFHDGRIHFKGSYDMGKRISKKIGYWTISHQRIFYAN